MTCWAARPHFLGRFLILFRPFIEASRCSCAVRPWDQSHGAPSLHNSELLHETLDRGLLPLAATKASSFGGCSFGWDLFFRLIYDYNLASILMGCIECELSARFYLILKSAQQIFGVLHVMKWPRPLLNPKIIYCPWWSLVSLLTGMAEDSEFVLCQPINGRG